MLNKILKASFKIVEISFFTIWFLLSSATFAEDVGKTDSAKEKPVTSAIINNRVENKTTTVVIDAKASGATKPEKLGSTVQTIPSVNENHLKAVVESNTKKTEAIKENTNVTTNNAGSATKKEDIKSTKEADHMVEAAKDTKNTTNTAAIIDSIDKSKGIFFSEEANYTESAEYKTKEGKETDLLKENITPKKTAQKGTAKTTSVSAGITEKSFADNEQINVFLSNRDINRVLVKGDKIQSINGPAGLYTAKNDIAGSAYISLYGETSFTIFISTVKGHNFSLLVSPRSIAGRTVILEPTSPSLLTARFEETESYQKVLVTLISGMINNEALEDYAYSEEKKPKKMDFYGVADIKPISFYSGAHLLGTISEIKNKSKSPIVLKPSYFYKPGVRAVALSEQTIGVSETGLLYQVISRE